MKKEDHVGCWLKAKTLTARAAFRDIGGDMALRKRFAANRAVYTGGELRKFGRVLIARPVPQPS